MNAPKMGRAIEIAVGMEWDSTRRGYPVAAVECAEAIEKPFLPPRRSIQTEDRAGIIQPASHRFAVNIAGRVEDQFLRFASVPGSGKLVEDRLRPSAIGLRHQLIHEARVVTIRRITVSRSVQIALRVEDRRR